MNVLVIESNLIWSERLRRSLLALGHKPTVAGALVDGEFDVAIVNLGEPGVDWPLRVGELQGRRVVVVGHAGHKEKPLHQMGREAGCDLLVTNSELTHKLGAVLEKAIEGKRASGNADNE